MRSLIVYSVTLFVMLAQPILVLGNDYTTRTYTAHSCELFAEDAYQAADTFRRGVVLGDILDLIENAPVAESMKHRAFKAIQLVWKNQLDLYSLQRATTSTKDLFLYGRGMKDILGQAGFLYKIP